VSDRTSPEGDRRVLESFRSILQRLAHPDARLLSAAFELLLIGTVIHLVLRFLRGTRGERLFRGVAMVLLVATIIVSLVADKLELERIKVLYPPFLVGMLLVALVAFQPELRRALIRLGATRFLSNLTGEMERVIDAVVECTDYCSRNKIGALIALERSTQLGALMESGTRLDAEISAPLLNTIFWPGSALHDMGVVVSQGRIAAAGVQFPLTETEGLDQTFGSRHRAALGLSEESDAVVVVVSEETGIISVFERGRGQRHLTPESLRDALRMTLGQPPAPEAPAEVAPTEADAVAKD
jgi:diadenylate cyclase